MVHTLISHQENSTTVFGHRKVNIP